jgi:hypothetical protein
MLTLNEFTAAWIHDRMHPGTTIVDTDRMVMEVWADVMGTAPVPKLVQYVYDAAVGAYALPCSHEIEAWLDSLDRTFEAWTEAAAACEEMATSRWPPAPPILIGAALLRVRARDEKAIAKAVVADLGPPPEPVEPEHKAARKPKKGHH